MAVLYYIHDPMCSWCWAFRPVWQKLQIQMAEVGPASLRVKYLLGGLAPDSDLPMPVETQDMIRCHWQVIEKRVPGTRFNYDFWSACSPRRSTYPACRAVIAARNQETGMEEEMIRSIQHAYYLQARNPSDDDVLMELASRLGLDGERFRVDLNADRTQEELASEIHAAQNMAVSSFPSLMLEADGRYLPVDIDYNDENVMLQQIFAR